jgi:hypothetical protein
MRPHHSSGSWSLGSHCGGPGVVMWDLWWTKWHWAGFLQVLLFPQPIFIPPIETRQRNLNDCAEGLIDYFTNNIMLKYTCKFLWEVYYFSVSVYLKCHIFLQQQLSILSTFHNAPFCSFTQRHSYWWWWLCNILKIQSSWGKELIVYMEKACTEPSSWLA